MKKIIIIIAALFISFSSFSQGAMKEQPSIYMQKMGESLAAFATCETIEDFNNLSNQFAIIANVEKSEWLPLYYAANCKILMSFMEQKDPKKKDAYLAETEAWFDRMEALAPEESEIYALKSMYYTAALTVNPMVRGQEYSMLSNEAAMKALSFDKDNPRAKYLLIANKVGFAKFFGKDITKECEEAHALLEIWDDYPVPSPIHPQWGKGQLLGLINGCK